jgi:fatty acid desaturase
MFSGFGSKERWKTERLYLISKIAYFSLGLFCLSQLHLLKDTLFYWFLPMFLIFPLIQRYRSIGEHFAVSYVNAHNSTRDVLAGWLEGFFLAPHNVHFHLTHHEYPHIPFYHLPKAHKHLCLIGEFKDAHINRAYLWPFSDSVLRDALYGPRAKISAEATPTRAIKPTKSA